MTSVDTALCRVTIVAPHTRMDVALPAHVPLAELRADLLLQAAASPGGEYFVKDGVTSGGWTIARLGEAPLDPDLSAAQLKLTDGDELYFRLARDTAPATVFDDVIDAIASAASERHGRWRAGTGRAIGLAAGTTAVAGAVAIAASVASVLTGMLVLVTGLVALIACWALARAFGRERPAVLLGFITIACGLSGGILVVSQGRVFFEIGAPQLLAGGCVAVLYAVLAGLVVEKSVPLFNSVATAGGALILGAGLATWLDVTASAAAATVSALALVFIPALPMISYRLARLPLPDIPRTPAELRGELQALDGELALLRSKRADEYFTGLLGACATAIGAGAVWLGLAGHLPATILCALLSCIALLKSRAFGTIRQRLPLLLSGLAGLASIAVATALSLPDDQRLAYVGGGLLALGAFTLVHALAVAGKKISPVWGRAGDILQIILTVAVPPMVLWVWGAYVWIWAI